jgi:streptomycin 6-kinase
MTLVPPDLPVMTELGRVAEARPWLDALPSLIDDVRDEWDLRLSAPLHGGSCSWVAPAERPDGTTAIVKIGWPHREMYGEPLALHTWQGRGAARLLAHDPSRHAMLLQRCEPGTELRAAPVDQLRTGCAVLRELWVTPPGELEPLGVVTAEWADMLEERMDRLRPGYDPGLVRHGATLLRTLPGEAGREVLLHGDINPGNILAHGDGWLAIDPKPMRGDPAYDPWPLIHQVVDPARPLAERYRVAAGELGCDLDRMRAWAFARAVEWALWSASFGSITEGGAELDLARTIVPR